MPWQDVVTLVTLVGVVVGIFMGRRKGRARVSAAVAAARAEGHAEAQANLAAHLVNVVQVGNQLPRQADDPIIDALRRVALERTRDFGTHDDHITAARQLDELTAGFDTGGSASRSGEHLELVGEWSAGGGDSGSAARGVGDGASMIECYGCWSPVDRVNDHGYCRDCA